MVLANKKEVAVEQYSRHRLPVASSEVDGRHALDVVKVELEIGVEVVLKLVVEVALKLAVDDVLKLVVEVMIGVVVGIVA